MSTTSSQTAVHKLGPLGAEPELSAQSSTVQQTVHRYAKEVMRPVGIELDRMTPEEAIAQGSPYWDAYRQFLDLGFSLDGMFELEPAVRAKTMSILFEELGWGDAGLAISFGAGLLPAMLTKMFGNAFCRALSPDNKLGCWAITEPDHGSDSLDPTGMMFNPEGSYGQPDCVATLRGNDVIINGKKSALICNGVIADVCILYCAADSGAGADTRRGVAVVVPLDARGVSRGKPVDKVGQRALNLGQIFFDNVTLSRDHIVAGPDQYVEAVSAIHTVANAIMGAVFTGTARSAFELAHAYAHERKQGGVPIIRQQTVASRLFHMFRKVEASRALAQRVIHYNFTATQPSLHAAMTTKVTGTQTALEVASDALQIYGGRGLTSEYPIEKIWRDARVSMIEDGCNEILAIKGGFHLLDPDLL